MPAPATVIAIASLKGGAPLAASLDGLARQTDQDFEVIVVDNSGTGRIERELAGRRGVRVLCNARNVGFAAAVNQAWRMSEARYLATLNDDAEPHPGWLGALRREMEAAGPMAKMGMCASQVRLWGTATLDSAGMRMGWTGRASSADTASRRSCLRGASRCCFQARRQRCTGARWWRISDCSTRHFFCIARTRIWGCARVGTDGGACMFRTRWWSTAIRSPRAQRRR